MRLCERLLPECWLQSKHLGPAKGVAEPAAYEEVGNEARILEIDRLSTTAMMSLVEEQSNHEGEAKRNL